jgi:hypothetical protein
LPASSEGEVVAALVFPVCSAALVSRFWVLFGSARDLECGSALLCRFGFSCFTVSVSGAWGRRKQKAKRETKAAEQSTAALQTPNKPNQSGGAKHRRTPH